jgi:5-methylcytosine-specific restriction endonuclease McrA
MRKETKNSIRTKADDVLQDYIRRTFPYCLVCSDQVSCGHHFVPKSNSNALRYYLPNIIPICRRCHSKVHTQPHLVEPKICFTLGKDWYDDLMAKKGEYVKANLLWYRENLERLEAL